MTLFNSDGTFTTYPTPFAGDNANPIVSDANGNVWFANRFLPGMVAKMDPNGTVTEFAVSGSVQALTRGPDGAIAFLSGPNQNTEDRIGQIASDGSITSVPITPPTAWTPGLVYGPAGDYWATQQNPPGIARITAGGTATLYSTVLSGRAADPVEAAVGSDGNVWFTEQSAMRVCRITPDGVLTQFPIAGDPTFITPGPDGAMWFTEANAGKIARITPDGSYSEYTIDPDITQSSVHPTGITLGADGNIWFTQQVVSAAIGRLNLGELPAVSAAGPFNLRKGVAFSGTVATFTDPTGQRTASDFSATIFWGDGSSVGDIAPLPGGGFVVTGSHTYAAEGNEVIRVSVNAPSDIPVTGYSSAIVDFPLTATGTSPVFATAGSQTASLPLLTFADADPNAAVRQFSALINWGDGQTSGGSVAAASSGSGFAVSGTHLFRSPGAFPIHVHVSDVGGSSVDGDISATIVLPVSFVQLPDLNIAGSPAVSASADLNGDGADDLVIGSGASFAVFLGRSDGTLAPPVMRAVGGNINAVSVADFNNDGKPDLFYLYADSTGQENEGVLLGAGDGTFTALPALPTIASPRDATHEIAVADLNRDGRFDVVAGGFGNAALVFLGSGDGHFSQQSVSLSAQDVTGVAAADFDGDRKTDLALSYLDPFGYGQVAVLRGNGDGTFAAPVRYAASNDLLQPLLADDLNGDHKPDLLVIDRVTSDLEVLLNSGDGTFGAASPTPLELVSPGPPNTFQPGPISAARLMDVNQDGRPDLVFTDQRDNSLRVRLGVGDGTFLPDLLIPLHSKPMDVTGGDFNQDGIADLVELGLTDGGQGIVQRFVGTLLQPSPFSPVTTEGLAQQLNLATFTTFAPGVSPSDFRASVDWGNGVTSGAVITAVNGTYTVTAISPYTEAGSKQAVVSVFSAHGLVATIPVPVLINDAGISARAANVSGTAGFPITAILATFTDANPFASASDFTATIILSPAASTTGTVVRQADGSFVVLGTFTYATAGSYSPIMTIKDVGGISVPLRPTVTVNAIHNGGASISGNLYTDVNQDGVRGIGEPPSVAWTVYLDQNNNGVLDPGEPRTISGADGSFTLADVPAGMQVVRVVVPAGWRQTSPAAERTVTLQTGQTLNGVDFGSVPLPPTVTAESFGFDHAPRTLSFTLSGDVSHSDWAHALQVTNLDTAATVIPAGFNYDPLRNVVTFTLPATLPNGNYKATLASSAVLDDVGQHLGAASDGTGGQDFTFRFFELVGDVNRDRTVGFEDLLALAQHYGSSGNFANGDVNADGLINFSDLLLMAQDYGASVLPPAASQVAVPSAAGYEVSTNQMVQLQIAGDDSPIKSQSRRLRHRTEIRRTK